MAALAGDADELARDWLLALLADAPLEAAGGVPVAELARHAPALCAAMARALGSDEELTRLAAGDLAPLAARAGRLAGAASAADAARAVEVLRGVVWSAALAELRRPDPALVAALADRLAAVAAAVTAATLRAGGAPASEGPPRERAAAPPPPAPDPLDVPAARPGDATAWEAAPPLAPGPAASPPPAGWDGAPAREDAEERAEVLARDLRPRIADGGHLGSLERAVGSHVADRRSFAVLLVELDGVERLLSAQADGEADEAIERAELAVESLLRPGDAGHRECPGRIWVTLPGTGPAGARALALRVSAAVEREADHRRVPLTASVGVAVFPMDATDARGLADRAEESLFAARASGSL